MYMGAKILFLGLTIPILDLRLTCFTDGRVLGFGVTRDVV